MSDEPAKITEQQPQQGVHVLPLDRTQYFNGFEMAIGQADIILTLKVNNQLITTFNFSLTTAKTLRNALTGTLDVFEKGTNHTILTIEEIKSAGAKMSKMIADKKLKEKQPKKLK